jgi:hypothetical protein
MGWFDFLLGRRAGELGQAEGPAMRPENPSWILVEGSSPDAIRKAVVEHSELTGKVQPSGHQVTILPLGAGRWGITFDPPAPPYAFTNLIGWLDDPEMTQGARRAFGWLVAPSSGIRYFLAPQSPNQGGDTLVGVGADGSRVSVYLPECAVSRCADRLTAITEPALPASGAPVVSFEVTLDADTAFGNPQFAVA